MPTELSSTKVLLALTLLKVVLCIELCGHSQNILRVVGGNETKPLEYPWMAYMRVIHGPDSTHRTNYVVKCDASLIDDQWLVSAAHCFHELGGSSIISIHVKLGAHNVTKLEAKQIDLQSKQARHKYHNRIYTRGLQIQRPHLIFCRKFFQS